MDNQDLCNQHYCTCLDCSYCLLLDDLDLSLLCKYHLHSIICCHNCIRIIHLHNEEKRCRQAHLKASTK